MERPTLPAQEKAAQKEFLKENQNLLDQEPYRSILLYGLVAGTRNWKGVDTSSPELIREAESAKTFEAARRHQFRVNAQAILIGMAKKYPEICATLPNIPKNERPLLFLSGWSASRHERFGVALAPLIANLTSHQRMDRLDIENQGYQLLGALMAEAGEHPGWDEYLREYRTKVLGDGERREAKTPIEIPTFESWAKS